GGDQVPVITRQQWGARPPKPDCEATRSMGDVDTAVIHYSDVAPPGDPANELPDHDDQAAGQVRAIQAFHMDTRGWCDIAYHWLIAPDGDVYEGRPLGVVGAHCLNHNTTTVGYCLLTNGPITDQQKTSLIQRLGADR